MPVEARTLELAQAGDADVAAWNRLADRAAEPNPFYRPEFVRAAAEAGDAATLLVAADGDEWIACLPVVRSPRWGRLRLPVLAPWMPDHAFVATPLLDRERVDEAADALVAIATAAGDRAALIVDPIDPDGPAGTAIHLALARARVKPIVYAEWERAALRRRSDPTYLQETLSGKRRKELRRQRRVLGEELGGEVTAADRTAEPEAWDRFLDLEASGWKGKEGTALARTPGGTAFFREMCAATAPTGRLQVLALEAGDRTAAMQCNLIDGRQVFCFKVAYEDSLARFGPGVQLEVDAIEVFHESLPADFIDSCAAPDSSVVNRMWPDRRRMQTLIVPTRSRRAPLIGPSLAAERIGRRVVRSARERVRRRPESAASSA